MSKTGLELIFEAIRNGDIDRVETIIAEDEQVLHRTDPNQSTPLTCAFACGHLDLAMSLIRRGANPFAMNHSDKWGMRSITEKGGISTQLRNGFVDIVITQSADIAEIFEAVWKRNSSSVDSILQSDPSQADIRLADPNGLDGFYNSLPYCGLSPLHYAVIAGDEVTTRLLLEAGAEPDGVPHAHSQQSRHTAMYYVPEGEEAIAELLVQQGANPNHTAMYLSEGSDSMRRVVVAHGAGGSPFLCSLVLRDFSKAEEILLQDPKVIQDRLTNARLDTPLHIAVSTGNLQTVEALINSGVDVDTLSRDGYTALAIAPECYCSLEMFQLLIRKGADVRAGHDSSLYAAVWQHAYGHMDYEQVIRLLAAKGSKPRGLIECVRAMNLNATQLLLELGADVNETDEVGFYSKQLGNAGHTALDYSTGAVGECVSRQIEDLLRSHGALTKAEIDKQGS